jgi:ABC-type amino acid transport substrate-binding protein
LFFLTTATARAAGIDSLIVLVDTSTEMPVADFRQGELVGGMHHDLGEALAQKMGRKASFLVLPRKRIALALDSGRADIICMYLPDWLPGHFEWSQAFFPQTELLISSLNSERPHSLPALQGKPIGTVLGFSYPELEQGIGSGFVRADGPSNLINLRKLAAGRVQHVATIKVLYDYQLKLGAKINVHPPLLIKQYLTRCAVSENGHVKLPEVDAAITQLVKDGAISKILSTYQ